MQFWYFFSLAFYAACAGILMSPYSALYYYLSDWVWDFDYDMPWSEWLEYLETYLDIGGFAFAGLLYAIQFTLMIRMVSTQQ